MSHTSLAHRAFRRICAATLSVMLGVSIVALSPAVDSASAAVLHQERQGFVTSPDGMKVNYSEFGRSARQAPTVLMAATWPWNSDIMKPLARILATHYHVVTYDPRGYGKSDHPGAIKDYTFEKLADEFNAVVKATAPGQKIHVLGFEWSSFIFSEYAFRFPGRIASFTSIGFPSIDIAEQHIRNVWKDGTPEDRARSLIIMTQAANGSVIGSMPIIPDLILMPLLPGANYALGQSQGDWKAQLKPEDVIAGRKMMSANMIQRQLSPQYDFLNVALLQIINLKKERFYDNAFIIDAMGPYTNNLVVREIDAARNLIPTYPITIANWTHEAIQGSLKIMRNK